MVLDEVLTKDEGMTYALMENIARRDMNRTDYLTKNIFISWR